MLSPGTEPLQSGGSASVRKAIQNLACPGKGMFYGCMGNPLTQLQSKDSVLKSVNSPWLALSSLEESQLKYHSRMMTTENTYKETHM